MFSITSRRLHSKTKRERCISCNPYRQEFKKIVSFPMGKQPLRVSVPVLYVRLSSSNIYKSIKNINVHIKKIKHSNYNLPRGLAPLLLLGAMRRLNI